MAYQKITKYSRKTLKLIFKEIYRALKYFVNGKSYIKNNEPSRKNITEAPLHMGPQYCTHVDEKMVLFLLFFMFPIMQHKIFI